MKNKKPLQVGGVFLCFETKLFHHIEAGTGFLGIEVMMPNDQPKVRFRLGIGTKSLGYRLIAIWV